MIEVRQASERDWPEISAFVSRNYGSYAKYKHRKRFEWQLQTDPYGGKLPHANSWLAISGSKVVGQISLQPGRVNFQKRQIDVFWIVDVMVDRDWRNRGIGQQIYNALHAKGANLLTLTMAPATRKMAERLNCLTLGPVYQLLRPQRVSHRTIKHILGERLKHRPWLQQVLRTAGIKPDLLIPIAKLALKLLSLLPRSKPDTLENIDVSRHHKIDEKTWLEAWACLRASVPACCDRSWQFFQWRYERVPDLRYGFSVATRQESVVGVLIWRLPLQDELNVGSIVDVVADLSDINATSALIADAINLFSEKCESVVVGTSHSGLCSLLKSHGFISVKTHRPVLVAKDLATRELFEQYSTSILFAKADHDWDQVHAAP